MKQIARNIVVAILGWQVRRLRRRSDFRVVAVAGSIGKTSTKFAAATVLGERFRVRYQKGNYNDLVTVPLVFFGLPMPSLFNPFAWAVTFLRIEKQLRSPYQYDVIVVEVGTDFPGNIAQFKKFLRADIGVLTAITPEHMEFFADLDAVAKEELTIGQLSDKVIANADLCDVKYLSQLKDVVTYGTGKKADYRLGGIQHDKDGHQQFTIEKNGSQLLRERHASVAETQLYSIAAAVTIADLLGVAPSDIARGIAQIHSVSGRMRQLKGIKGSIILDDTYNASPEATKAALNTLYKIPAPQKIALLGNMNELGKYSANAHKEIGKYCDPEHLDLVVTLGPDANQYTAAAAEKSGCKVIPTTTPLEAAEVIIKHLKKGGAVLAKGSQNGVYAEEAVKRLLANPADAELLVRQSPAWMKKKASWLGDLS